MQDRKDLTGLYITADINDANRIIKLIIIKMLIADMRKKIMIFSLLMSLIPAFRGYAQVPEKMSFQLVVRDLSGVLITGTPVGVRISIIKGPLPGVVVYQETKTPETTENGMVILEIGGEPGFDAIDWSDGQHFIKTDTDPEGGTNYTIFETRQILSVPYTLISRTAQKVIGRFCYADKDNDGCGDSFAPVWIPGGVDLPAGFVLNGGDSDDLNPSVH